MGARPPHSITPDMLSCVVQIGEAIGRVEAIGVFRDVRLRRIQGPSCWPGSAGPASTLLANSVFHYEFEFIHPVEDGNGCLGPLWQMLILTRWKPLFAHIPVASPGQ